LKCKICSREAIKHDFCAIHLRAYENVVEKYQDWREALNISWNQYLLDIQKNSLTGAWAKEVAKYLIEEEKEDVR
jgi:hypothetical protein